jgi:hypothetical protein
MPLITPVTNLSDKIDVTNASTQFATLNAMAAGQRFRFISTTACWIKQAANPTASAAAGSMYVAAGELVNVKGDHGAKLAVIRASADGIATLTPVQVD